MWKQARLFALAALSLVSIAGSSFAAEAEKPTPLKIGVTAGPHAEIMEVVKTEAVKYGLDLKIVEFNDYIQPNAALAQGDLDANSYQHQPFLDRQIADRGYDLIGVGKTIIAPLGIYSRKVKKIDDLANGAKIGIPNDPTNGGRALLVLQTAGIIKLDPAKGVLASPQDVTDNPKKVKFIELDAAQLPRSLDDLDAAAINTNFAIQIGLTPTKDAIAVENAQSKFVNLLVIQPKNREKPWVEKLVKAYHSDPVKKFIEDKYQGSFLVGW